MNDRRKKVVNIEIGYEDTVVAAPQRTDQLIHSDKKQTGDSCHETNDDMHVKREGFQWTE